ncbi:MAG TPA: alpha/beta hydrolase [Streptosporangiaceae bacterium]|nr:alpha/beta hydrolase [Streptosporangiaceae bacterium]
MTVPTSAPASRTFDLRDGLTVTVTQQGDATAAGGTGVLLLHGAGGPLTVAGFGAALAEDTYVITPVHPGFDGQPRPDWTDRVSDLASAYLDLLDILDLRQVLVIGSSMGGWVAAEMALRDNHRRIGGLVLLNAAGIQAGGQEIADITSLTPAELGRLSFYNPAFRPDLSALNEQQLAAVAANQRTLAVYAADPYLHDPKLRRRLHRVTVPVLVAWGEEDGVIPVDYGRAYAESFPNGRFELIPEAGHLPHLEQAARTLELVRNFADSEVARPVAG